MRLFAMAMAALSVFVAGCDDPGCAKIDDCNPTVKVVEYSEGLFHAVIKYDYSQIENYDPNKMHVVAVLSDFHKNKYKRSADAVMVELCKFRPDLADERINLREDPVSGKGDGWIKVECADTVGSYILVYVP